MDQNLAIEILRKNFKKWLDSHQENLRFLISQLYKLFDSIITISVAVVGIIIPIILNFDHPTNAVLLWISFWIFVAVILVGICWRFISLKISENRWPKILQQESGNFHKSTAEIKQSNTNDFLKIIEKNFQSGTSKNAYRTKIFEIVFVVLFCLGIILLAFSLLPDKIIFNSMFQEIGEARLGINGEKVKLYEADTKGNLGKIFLFTGKDNSIYTTISVENLNIESPKFRIIKGHSRDWLVVTTIGNSGTGYLKYTDTWYVANSYYQANPAILSYPSNGYIYEWVGLPNQELTTNIRRIYENDDVIEIEFDLELCETKDKCIITKKLARFNFSKNKFILDDKQSEIYSSEINQLLILQ